MSSVDGELGSSGCISPIIRGCCIFLAHSVSFLTLPPSLSVHLLKFPLFRDLFFSFFFFFFFFFSTPPCPLTTSTLPLFLHPLLPLPLHGPGYGLNMTAIPLKRGGIIIIIRAHQRQAAPWTNLSNTEKGDAAETPTHPQPWGSYVSI